MTSCPLCEAPIRPTATFCLACDNPVVPESSRLSVGDPVPVQHGRPLVGLALIAAAVLALGGTTYGAVAFVHHQHAASTAQVVHDITRGATLLVDAESGDSTACARTARVLAGPSQLLRQECTGIVDRDPGVRVDKIRVDRLDLGGRAGTARLRETVTDDRGTRTLERVVHLVHESRVWRLSWDGRTTV
jgi:hypothetical protein